MCIQAKRLSLGVLAWLWLAATLPSLEAQMQASVPPQVIRNEIKAYAARHARSGAGLKTEVILDLYRNNTAGLTPTEVVQLYEAEYLRQKEAMKPGPWDRLRPNVGWIVIGILGLGLIIYKALEEWGKDVLKRSAGEMVWRPFAGNLLRRYQKALVEKYSKVPIPFSGRKLEMREIFVPLKVAGSSGADQLDAYDAMTNYTRLMIVGPPGSGKSMLLKHLALEYAEGRLTGFPGWPVPILLELHYLDEKPDLSLEDHLVDELARNGFPKAQRFVERNLKLGRLMLLFDGLDEVKTSERSRIVAKIKDLMDRQRGCRVVITCRNVVYQGEFADRVDQTLEIVEFSDQQIRMFLWSWWKPHMPRDRSIEQLMQILRERPRIMALARNPMLLTITAYLYTDTRYVIPHSRAEFYKQSTEVLLDRHRELNVYDAREKQAVLQHLALYYQDSAGRCQQDRLSVDFRTVLEQIKAILTRLHRNPELDARPLLKEIVDRSYLLLPIDGERRYQFAHLTLQEYYAAEQLFDDADGLFDRFRKDRGTWRETVKLWCGLNHDSTPLVAKVYAEDPITALECLADAQQVDQALSEQIVDGFKTQLAAGGDMDALARAFGSVASDPRPRGASVFDFLEGLLVAADDPVRLRAAAVALSFTNLPRAAEVLVRRLNAGPDIHMALVRMGDLAVSQFGGPARAGERAAMDVLLTIGTPQAAMALVPALFRDDPGAAQAVAWRLAAMIRYPDIEESLRHYPLTEEHCRADVLSWVWRPFKEPPSSSLPILAGRIALLLDRALAMQDYRPWGNSEIEWTGLDHADLQSASAPSPEMDSRIVIPLVIKYSKYLNDKIENLKNLLQSEKLALPALIIPQVHEELEKIKTLIKRKNLPSTIAPQVLKESVDSPIYVIATLARRYSAASMKRGDLQSQEHVATFLAWLYDSCKIAPKLRYLLQSLPARVQLEILAKLDSPRVPSPIDWINLNRSIKYDFDTGWHRRVVSAVVLFITLLAVYLVTVDIYRSGNLLGSNKTVKVCICMYMLLPYIGLEFLNKNNPDKFKNMLLFYIVGVLIIPIILLAVIKDVIIKKQINGLWGLLAAFVPLWFPLIVYLTTPPLLGMGYPWQAVAVGWIVLLVACGLLIYTGMRLSRSARNPLQGILDVQTEDIPTRPLTRRPTKSFGDNKGFAGSSPVSGLR